MSLFSELDAKDKDGLFRSDDNIVCYPTGFAVLDYANGYWTEIMDKNGQLTHVPNLGIPGGSLVSIIGSTGGGKAIPVDTMLPTPDGMKRAGDIKVGDLLFDRTGAPTRVRGVYPQGPREVNEVTFSDGRVARCCEDHLWTVICGYGSETEIKTLPLKEIRKDYRKSEYCDGTRRIEYVSQYSVPIPGAVQFNPRSLHVNPMLVGVIIANTPIYTELHYDEPIVLEDCGEYLMNALSQCSGGFDIVEHPKQYFGKTLFTMYIKERDSFMRYSDIFETKEEFEEFYRDGEIHIPKRYLLNDIVNRKNFLIGILNGKNAQRFESKSGTRICVNELYVTLAEEVVFIIRSLGFSIRMDANPFGELEFTIPMEMKPFQTLLDYKKTDPIVGYSNRTVIPNVDRLFITDIKRTNREEEMVCFLVDNVEHLFLTENFVPTHNTTLATQIGWNIVKNFEDGLMFVIDCEKSSERERITNILGCDRDEPRIRITKAKSSIDDVLESFDLLCRTKESGGKKYMYEIKHRSFSGESFWAYVPTVYIIDSLPKFNCRDFNDKDLGGNIDAMRGAKDVTRFYTNVVDRAWQYNVIFIVINHIRPNSILNPYAPPPRGLMMINPQSETLPRGSVAQYYSSIYFRINSKKSAAYTLEDDGFTGFKCEIQLAKSRTNIIGSTFPITFNSDRGFDPIYSMYEFAHANGLVQGRNPYLFLKGFEERKFNRKEFITLMTVDENFRNGVLTVLKPFYESLLSSKRERVADIKNIPDLSMNKKEDE